MKEPSFIEVVKVKDGVFIDAQPHINRIFRTTSLFFRKPLIVELTDNMIPMDLNKGVIKCRIVYNSQVISIEFEPYKMRSIASLAIVEDSTIDYSYKYLNRDHINKLFARREECDDILIVKNTLITDTSYSNLVLKD